MDLTGLLPAAGRGRRTVLLAVVVGSAVGLAVAAFERLVVSGILSRLFRAPLAVQATAPLVGLGLTALVLRVLASGASPSTADEYIKNFHERDRRLDLHPVFGRVAASVLTLGSGCAMGLEGPSVYMGSAIGSAVQARTARWFSREDAKALLVAGAAAGVAAIFKAPATGALFALEVPFQADLARRMLLPALFAASMSYLTFVAINGTTPLFPVAGSPALDFKDLASAVAIGLLAGLAARLFACAVRAAKRLSTTAHPIARILGAGIVLAAVILASKALTGDTLALGPGYRTITWAIEPRHAVGEVIGLLVLRGLATTTAVAGGGAGGLFIPLVIEGALLGRAVGGAVGTPGSSLFPVLGVAAFLGAGYRVPLAAVMFVAESTGKPAFVVPGLIAAAASQLTMGSRSVSTYQQARRAGHLEQRLDLPLASLVRTDAATVPPDATLSDLFTHHMLGVRLLSVPVVDRATYLGTIDLHDVAAIDQTTWDETLVCDVMKTDRPVADLGWTIGQ
ncbi:MAG TPA: chloride channel protein, partial [Acidimicrobiales bacterium]|nr:chloride channel protein [Acidimicrobiales bacterium]